MYAQPALNKSADGDEVWWDIDLATFTLLVNALTRRLFALTGALSHDVLSAV